MLPLESRYLETMELFMCWEGLVGLGRGEKGGGGGGGSGVLVPTLQYKRGKA